MAQAAGASREAGLVLSRPAWRYAVFFSVYLFQGLVAGFSLTALANYYAQLGFTQADIGRHFALVGLPWTLQPLWGPLVDRVQGFRMGRRRVWVVLALAGSHASLSGLLLVEDPAASVGAVSAIFLAHSLFASLLDTAVDGMIIDHVPCAELGRASACVRGGFVSGAAFSAALFSWSLQAQGFRTTVSVLIALGLAVTLVPLLVRERGEDALLSLARRAAGTAARAPTSLGRFLTRLLLAVRRREALTLLALCFTMGFAVQVFQVRLLVEMVQLQGWDPAALSRLQAGLDFAGGTVGALLVGLWSDRAGPARTLRALFAFCAAGFLLASAIIALGLSGRAGPLILALGSVVPGLLYVALVPAVMRASRPAVAATQFALFMAAMNLGDVAGAAASSLVKSILSLPATALGVALVFAGWALLARRPDLLFRTPADAHLSS